MKKQVQKSVIFGQVKGYKENQCGLRFERFRFEVSVSGMGLGSCESKKLRLGDQRLESDHHEALLQSRRSEKNGLDCSV